MMNRRSLLFALGVFASGVIKPGSAKAMAATLVGSGSDTGSLAMPESIAGIRIIDSAIAKAATTLSKTVSPAYLFNHAVRTYLYASLIGRTRGQRYDEEALYLACVLHDLGLTDRFAGDLPFEIQGAEAAKRFLSEHGYSAASAEIVWDGIAMHATAIGEFKRPEIALVGEGAGADVLGPDSSEVTTVDSEAILRAFPRLKFKDAFIKTCADVVRKHPRGASRSFMRDVGERYVPNFHPRNFCDLLAQAPFEE